MILSKLIKLTLGDKTMRRQTYVSAKVDPPLKAEVIKVLKEFIDCFARDYDEMSRLRCELVELKISIRPDKKLVKQTPLRFAPEIMSKI